MAQTLKEKLRNFVEEIPLIKAPKKHDLKHTKDGREMVSGIPKAKPLGYKKHKTIQETIREMIRSEQLRREAEAAGLETLEEADDFEIGDDFDPTSPYEYSFDPPTDVHPGTMGETELSEYNEWREAQFEEWKKFRRAVKTAKEEIDREANEPTAGVPSDRTLESRVARAQGAGEGSPNDPPPLPRRGKWNPLS